MMDYDFFTVEALVAERQQSIRAEVAGLRHLPVARAGGVRRALAAALAALARWLDPAEDRRAARPVPAPNR
jgi:hypothetical protein